MSKSDSVPQKVALVILENEIEIIEQEVRNASTMGLLKGEMHTREQASNE